MMMKINPRVKVIVVMAVLALLPCVAQATSIDKAKLAAAEKKFTTVVSNFNGKVDVAIKDKDRAVTSVEIELLPGENLKVPRGMPYKKGAVTWKDVAKYELMLSREEDVYARWFIENLWRDRINKVLVGIEKYLKEKYPLDYAGINIKVKDVADALGIDPPVGFLSGEQFIKVPNGWGGRIPNVDPELLEKALSKIPDVYISERPNRSASPYI